MPAMMDISIAPLGTGSASMGDLVVEMLKVIDEHQLRYHLNPTGTTVEGPVDKLLACARAMHERCFAAGAPRVVTIIRLDDRRDKDLTMEYKVDSVLAKLGRKQ